MEGGTLQIELSQLEIWFNLWLTTESREFLVEMALTAIHNKRNEFFDWNHFLEA